MQRCGCIALFLPTQLYPIAEISISMHTESMWANQILPLEVDFITRKWYVYDNGHDSLQRATY